MVNLGAPIRVRVTAAGEHTLLAEIVRLVEAAERGRSRFIAIADRVARAYAPVVHVTALLDVPRLDAAGRPCLGPRPADRHRRADHHLSLRAGAGRPGRPGRRFRRGCCARASLLLAPTALERLAKVDHVVLDKTGTLTLGRPDLVEAGPDTEALRAGRIASPPIRAIRWPRPWSARRPTRSRRREWSNIPDRACSAATSVWARPASVASQMRPMTAGRSFGSRGPALGPCASPSPIGCVADAAEAVAALRHAGLTVELLSGDRPAAVARAAAEPA